MLAPVAIAAAYLGGWLFLGLCGIAATIILDEWTVLTAGGRDLRILVPGAAALLAAVVLIGNERFAAAIGAAAIGTILVAGAVSTWPRRYPGTNSAWWAAAGMAYAGVTLLGPSILRSDPKWGFAALLCLFATVWATDIFAYLAGRTFGGPLLCPKLSPKKTWSGVIGGLLGGVAAGALVAYASAGTAPLVGSVLALILSVAAQGGDLLESAVKRRFGVKDASNLIPGHGGMMDRLDGFLVAALVALLIGSAHQNLTAPAQGLLSW